MAKIEGVCKEVIEKSEWVAIATAGTDGPHVVGCWTRNICALGIEEKTLMIPAWRFHKTEENLRQNSRVELLFASLQVERPDGHGQGCSISGMGEIQTSGKTAEAVKAKFPWARGVLIVHVIETKVHLGE